MKTCEVCGAIAAAEVPTCVHCGEASWKACAQMSAGSIDQAAWAIFGHGFGPPPAVAEEPPAPKAERRVVTPESLASNPDIIDMSPEQARRSNEATRSMFDGRRRPR